MINKDIKLHYVGEHTSCCNYANFSNHLSTNGPVLMNYHFEKGHIRRDILSISEIVFMLEGACLLTFDGTKDLILSKGHIVLLPVGCQYVAEITKDSSVFVCRISPDAQLCDKFSLENLYREKNKTRTNVSMLEMNKRIWDYVNHTVACLDDGLRCTKFLQLKADELMYIFRGYYTKDELAAFFYPILNKDMEFSRIILQNWVYVKNKTDLAALTNLSPSRFGTKFKDIFGTSPYQWLMTRKSERIYNELSASNVPFKQISDEFQFSSVQHFNDFCKKQFGRTPGQIRRLKSE